MNFFYLRHHYQSIVRSTSFDGEVFAFFVLAILFGSSISLTYDQLGVYAETVSIFFSQNEVNHSLFLVIYLFLDLVIRMVFRRPLPKLKYYVLWCNASKQIAGQYLVTSMFGIMPFILVISMLTVAMKSNEWLGMSMLLSVMIWWLANHFIGLISQFAHKRVKPIIVLVLITLLLIQWFVPTSKMLE